MFNENLKTLRKSKGFTQEELAIKVNVVRQTVSKWEKGLSVPDAVSLQKIADVLDVGVNELLGADLANETNANEVAEQLARINEQLAIKNRRWNRFWKILGAIVLVVLFINIVGYILFGAQLDSSVESPSDDTVYEQELDMENLDIEE